MYDERKYLRLTEYKRARNLGSNVRNLTDELRSYESRSARRVICGFHPVAARCVVFIINAVDSFWKVKFELPTPVSRWNLGRCVNEYYRLLAAPISSFLIIPQHTA